MYITKKDPGSPYEVREKNPMTGCEKTLFRDSNPDHAMAFMQGRLKRISLSPNPTAELYIQPRPGHRGTTIPVRHVNENQFKIRLTTITSVADLIEYCEKASRTSSFRITVTLNMKFHAFRPTGEAMTIHLSANA